VITPFSTVKRSPGSELNSTYRQAVSVLGPDAFAPTINSVSASDAPNATAPAPVDRSTTGLVAQPATPTRIATANRDRLIMAPC
jgi:hypothetical protein